jgi:hypothetical protein
MLVDVTFAIPLPAIAIVGTGESATGPLNVAVIVTVSPFLYGDALLYVIAAVGAVVSITKVVKVRLLAFPAASVTVIVLSAYVPAPNVLNVIVWLLPVAAEEDVENPSVILVLIVPASPVVNT